MANHLRRIEALEARAEMHRVGPRLIILESGEHDHRRIGPGFFHPPDTLDARVTGHTHIHQYHVRLVYSGDIGGVHAIVIVTGDLILSRLTEEAYQ